MLRLSKHRSTNCDNAILRQAQGEIFLLLNINHSGRHFLPFNVCAVAFRMDIQGEISCCWSAALYTSRNECMSGIF